MKKILSIALLSILSNFTFAEQASKESDVIQVRDVTFVNGIKEGFSNYHSVVLKDSQNCRYYVPIRVEDHVSGNSTRIFSDNQPQSDLCRNNISPINLVLLDENMFNGIELKESINPGQKAKIILFLK